MLKQMLERHEGRKNKPYKDIKGLTTIGVGHNVDGKGLPKDIKDWLDMHGWISEEMIDRLLNADIADAQKDCRALYPDFDNFSQARQDALTDFVYNVGKGTAMAFIRTNKAINSGDWKSASEGLLKSLYAKQVKGRAIEIAKMLEDG
jgi:lysozyme